MSVFWSACRNSRTAEPIWHWRVILTFIDTSQFIKICNYNGHSTWRPACDCALIFQRWISEVRFSEFWLQCTTEYPQLADEPLSVLQPFLIEFICEVDFSAMAIVKAKYRSRQLVSSDSEMSGNHRNTKRPTRCQSTAQTCHWCLSKWSLLKIRLLKIFLIWYR